MAWSARLLADMAATTLHPLFLLETVAVNDVPFGGYYAAATDPTVGDPVLAAGGVRVQGSSVRIGSWDSTLGGFSVDLAGDLRALKASITRGTFVRLSIGFPGYKANEYEPVAIGQVQQLSGTSPSRATLSCRDLLSALRCRATGTAGQLELGYRMDGIATDVSADYTAGDGTLHLTSSTGFGGGIASVALITPAAGGDPFFGFFSGISGNDLTGFSGGLHGTTDADAAATSEVRPVWYYSGHPATIARHALLSVLGTGVHVYDGMPQGDGLSLPYDWVDHDDCDATEARTDKLDWQVITSEPQSDPLGWISGWLAAGGLFVTVRMGLLTIRAWSATADTLWPDMGDITDDDVIAGGWTWDAWDADSASEATNVTAWGPTTDASAGSDDPATLPAHSRSEYDLSDLVFSAELDQLQNVVGRLYEAHKQIPERYTATCAGLRLAYLAPGDRVRLYSAQVAGRLSQTHAGLQGVRGQVIAVDTDYGTCMVTLTVLVYPASEDVFP